MSNRESFNLRLIKGAGDDQPPKVPGKPQEFVPAEVIEHFRKGLEIAMTKVRTMHVEYQNQSMKLDLQRNSSNKKELSEKERELRKEYEKAVAEIVGDIIPEINKRVAKSFPPAPGPRRLVTDFKSDHMEVSDGTYMIQIPYSELGLQR